MSFLYMGFSFEDDLEKKEEVVQLIDGSRGENGLERELFEFWPLQHPTEPSHEDRPVQCPIPHSSLINDGRMQDERFSERKRPELSTAIHKEHISVDAAEPPARAVRKRHHTLTHTDQDHVDTITPLLQMPPMYPHTHQNMMRTFDNLQHANKFRS